MLFLLPAHPLHVIRSAHPPDVAQRRHMHIRASAQECSQAHIELRLLPSQVFLSPSNQSIDTSPWVTRCWHCLSSAKSLFTTCLPACLPVYFLIAWDKLSTPVLSYVNPCVCSSYASNSGAFELSLGCATQREISSLLVVVSAAEAATPSPPPH